MSGKRESGRAAGALAVALALSALGWAGNLEGLAGLAGLLTFLAIFILMYVASSTPSRARVSSRMRAASRGQVRHSA